jgi:hypothetical protein
MTIALALVAPGAFGSVRAALQPATMQQARRSE